MKYFIKLSYKGTKFRGWQTQSNVVSIQQTIETALSRMTHQKVLIHGCGRTDAQVHANEYFAHVRFETHFDYDPVFRLNKMLPNDIRIHAFFPVEESANAQRSATARTYRYFIHGSQNAFIHETSWFHPNFKNLNHDAIRKALKFMTCHEDYFALCKQPNSYPHTICYVKEAVLDYNEENNTASITITANRFLKAMIRIMVGRMIAIGSGKLTVEDFKSHLKNKEVFEPLTLAPPQGLHLIKVEYPFLNDKSESLVKNENN